jgi:diketogulonate reductase-like aldo/keto reductase
VAVVVDGVAVPSFFFGTAWREERSAELTALALRTGFRAVDTANQRRHYFEEAVGTAVHEVLAESGLARGELFLQTKFTYAWSQDERLPYDVGARPSAQVAQSLRSSLEHLRTEYVDSYLLHGPSVRGALADDDWEVWHAMHELKRAGTVRLLGVSNVSLEQLSSFDLELKPSFVQNPYRLHRVEDRDLLDYCLEHGIAYQGYAVVRANSAHLDSQEVLRVARRTGRTPAQVLIRSVLQRGVLPVAGTSDPVHMREYLECEDFALSGEDLACLGGRPE